MARVIAICGKICSGKSYYSNQIKNKEKAVILSCDEITNMLFDNNLGENHDAISKRIKEYLLLKATQIVNAGTNVILDWGFWSKSERIFIKQYYISKGIACEWHYININDESWHKNIDERNKKVEQGNGNGDFYLDEGLMKKLLCMWEEPSKDEIDIWHYLKR